MRFISVTGQVKKIHQAENTARGSVQGCLIYYTIKSKEHGEIHLIASSTTYFLHQEVIRVGDTITCFYDGDAPVALIYPPQYHALVIVKEVGDAFVTMAYFDHHLLREDGQLKLTIDKGIPISFTNGQPYRGMPTDHYLIVLYGPTTRSIPAQTVPYEIIVWCEED